MTKGKKGNRGKKDHGGQASAAPRFFIVGQDGRTPREAGLEEWLAWIEETGGSVRVALDEADGTRVSTVFISKFTSQFPEALPWHFETLVTAEGEDRVTGRYATWDEAEKGHVDAVSAFLVPGARSS